MRGDNDFRIFSSLPTIEVGTKYLNFQWYTPTNLEFFGLTCSVEPLLFLFPISLRYEFLNFPRTFLNFNYSLPSTEACKPCRRNMILQWSGPTQSTFAYFAVSGAIMVRDHDRTLRGWLGHLPTSTTTGNAPNIGLSIDLVPW